MTRIFSDRHRSDVGPASYLEPHYDYIDRTARPQFEAVREVMEDWLARFPARHRSELARRLQSRDDHHFEAAFFELYLYTLCNELRFRVRVHPRAGGKGGRPDFLLYTPASSFLMEAATVDELGATERAARNRLVAIYDALNALDCPDYFLHVRHFGSPKSPVPLKSLSHRVVAFLNTLDYDAVVEMSRARDLDALPHMSFQHDGCEIELAVSPVSAANRGKPTHRPIGVTGAVEARMVDDHTPVRDKIRKKARRYGPIRRPLVIAINAAGRHLEHIDIMQALFGREAYTFSQGKPEAVMTRIPDGVWYGPRGPQNRRISAVLFVSSLLPWSIAAQTPTVYHNPWARLPLGDTLGQLDNFTPSNGKMVFSKGRPIHALLRFPERWPTQLPEPM